MTDFIGRERELAALEEAHGSRRSAFVPVYGRRRVGKSELILHFLAHKRGIYYLGKRSPAAEQIREFLRVASLALREPLLASLSPNSWKAALEAVSDRWKGPAKLVLALDEFQWIVEASPELPSVLQELWDRRWKDRNHVLLVLCGSFVGFMEREVFGRKSPLFGRRTAQIHLQPFGYREAALFHPSYSLPDRARAYFICGGVPLYLQSFRASRSLESNIEANLLEEFAPLFREPEFLLREELREVETYNAVLMALAGGALPSLEIARRAGVGDRALQYYLKQLVEMGYVARRYPLTGATPRARDVRYAIEDPLLRFWFRFVFPNTSYILSRGAQRGFADLIRPDLDAYFGGCFERLCREALGDLYARERVTAAYETGEYWDRRVQVDLVGLRADGWTDLGECKWGRTASAAALEAEIRRKAALYPNSRNATLGVRVFTRSRPAGRPSGEVRWHDLEDLYRVERSHAHGG